MPDALEEILANRSAIGLFMAILAMVLIIVAGFGLAWCLLRWIYSLFGRAYRVVEPKEGERGNGEDDGTPQ